MFLTQEASKASPSLFAHEIILEWGEEVADDGDAPGAAQNFLPLPATHVVDIGVVFGEAKDPARKGAQERLCVTPSHHNV